MQGLGNDALDPFALARLRRIRARAEKTKAQLQAHQEEGADEFLSANTCHDSQRVYRPEYDPPLPIAVRRLALRANHKIRSIQRRRHQRTGRTPGPRRDDQGVAREVLWYERDYGMSRIAAMSLLAEAIAAAESIELKSALARVRRALRKS